MFQHSRRKKTRTRGWIPKYPVLSVATMKFSSLVFLGGLSACSAFSFQQQGTTTTTVNIDGKVQRDVFAMAEWALGCGVQKAEGFQVDTKDGVDYFAYTNQDLPAGSPVLAVPGEMLLSASGAEMEFGAALDVAKNELANAGLESEIPLFCLFVKVLVEYEKGEQSPWYTWLDSLPRLYNTGASMTYSCFNILPPYAAWLAMTERTNSDNFRKAAEFVQRSGLIGEATATNADVLKWAYNVAQTRSFDRSGQKFIAPLADMFNHGSDPEVEIVVDEQGGCSVYAVKDVPASSPLRMSLGDPTNPSPLFAKYGFLDESSPASFCKAMHLREEMSELGYDFSDLLFYKDTGDISMPVYDVFLYSVLKQADPNLRQGFYEACVRGDEETKQSYHQEYFPYTKEALQDHVNGFLDDLKKLSDKAYTMNRKVHPRVPVILQHNAFTKETFQRVKANLDNM